MQNRERRETEADDLLAYLQPRFRHGSGEAALAVHPRDDPSFSMRHGRSSDRGDRGEGQRVRR